MDTIVEDPQITEEVLPEEYKSDMEELTRLTNEVELKRITRSEHNETTKASTIQYVRTDGTAITEEDKEKLVYPGVARIVFGSGLAHIAKPNYVDIAPEDIPTSCFENYTAVLEQMMSVQERNIGFDRIKQLLLNLDGRRRMVHLEGAHAVASYLAKQSVHVDTNGEKDEESLRKLFEVIHALWSFNPIAKSEKTMPVVTTA